MKKDNSENDLIKIASEIELFHTPDGKYYGVIQLGDHKERWQLDSIEIKRFLKNQYFSKYKNFPSTNLLSNVTDRLVYNATVNSLKKKVYTRIARINNSIHIDLCNKKGEVVKITKNGWKVVKDSSVNFIRPKVMLPLSKPIKCTSRRAFSQLNNFINASGRDCKLIISWLLGALAGKGPYPILVLLGEPGSGKSTIMEMLRSLIDPAHAPLKSLPRSERDLMISAEKSLVLAYDNVSTIPKWLSDAFCRMSTGGGLSTRELYSDAGEISFDAERPVMLNGIGDMVRKSDLSDRAITVTMKTIKDTKRRSKKQFMAEFNDQKPRFIGALFDAASEALKNIDDVNLDKYPRMADFLRWIVAAEPSVFKKGGQLEQAYTDNIKNMSSILIESDSVGTAIKRLLKNDGGEWSGTSNNLLKELEALLPADKKERILRDGSWPKAANSLSARLTEIAPDLRKIGIEYYHNRRSSKKRLIRLKKFNGKAKANKEKIFEKN